MASVSSFYSSSSTFKTEKLFPRTSTTQLTPISSSILWSRNDSSILYPLRSKIVGQNQDLKRTQSVAREVPADLSKDEIIHRERKGLEKDSFALWRRYVDWMYQHKELGLFLDVSRVGFTDEFVEKMEPKFQAAFKDMEELEKGSIANPDEGRMVGHYWLRNSSLSPTSHLRLQIDNTLEEREKREKREEREKREKEKREKREKMMKSPATSGRRLFSDNIKGCLV